MGIRYFFSGFDKDADFTPEIASLLHHDIKNPGKLVYIPTDFSLKEKIEMYSKGCTYHFEKIGLNFEAVIVLNENMPKEEMQRHIINANVVYLMGGNPISQLQILENYNLTDLIISTNAVVMGVSAGAMCMSKYCLCLPVSEQYPVMDVRPGMNLSGISIYPHYNTGGVIVDVHDSGKERTRKSDILEANRKYGEFFLMSDDTAIREENGELDFVGEGIIRVSNGSFSNV